MIGVGEGSRRDQSVEVRKEFRVRGLRRRVGGVRV